MFYLNWWNPVVSDTRKPPPVEPFAFLTSPTQGMFPPLGDFIPKGMHSIHIAQHSKVNGVTH
jgi:hypothetical protein